MCPNPDRSHLASRVLHSIESGRVAMRSKLSLVAERLGLEGIGVLLFLATVLAVNLIFFWARSTHLADSLAFGSVGLSALLEAFPYQWLILGLVASVAVIGLVKTLRGDDRPASSATVAALVASAVLIGMLGASAGMTDRLLAAASRTDRPAAPARAVYALTEHRGKRSVVGSVVETTPTGFIVQVGREHVVVTVTSRTQRINVNSIGPGDRILVVGSASEYQSVEATGVRRLPPLRVPRINWPFQRHPVPVSS